PAFPVLRYPPPLLPHYNSPCGLSPGLRTNLRECRARARGADSNGDLSWLESLLLLHRKRLHLKIRVSSGSRATSTANGWMPITAPPLRSPILPTAPCWATSPTWVPPKRAAPSKRPTRPGPHGAPGRPRIAPLSCAAGTS